MSDVSDNSSATGHRERLRQRFLARESSALDEAALLELLLSYAIPRRDVRPLAESLLATFGSAAAVLSAPSEALLKVPGLKDHSLALVKLAHELKTLPDCAPSSTAASKAPVSAVPETVPTDPEAAPAADALSDDDDAPSTAGLVAEPGEDGKLKRTEQPKLQVSNGYSFDPAQNARLLTHIAEHPEVRRFTRRELMEGLGLSEGQVEGLTSIAAALGLVAPVTAVLTPFGSLVTRHDLFLDTTTTLEFCHFLGAGNPRNLVWHTVFSDLLHDERPTDQAGWSARLRERFSSRFSDKSLVKHVASEVRFVVDAYTVKNLKKLHLLYETPEQTYTLRRYTALQPLSLAAMIYWIGERQQARLVSVDRLHTEPTSPSRLFGLDSSSLRGMIEQLHQKGWIRYEVRHGLDQVRLSDGFGAMDFLAAAYEGREPVPVTVGPTAEPEPYLL